MTLVVVATSNPHKLAELRGMIGAAVPSAEVVSASAFGPPPAVEESGATFEANAAIKARAYDAWLEARGAPRPRFVIADDSGICVDALGGAPGVRSARFAGEGASDADNNRALVRALEARGLRASPAHYACVLALLERRADGSTDLRAFEGRFDVEVRVTPRGSGGFGYDPHAYLPDGRTVAELDPAEKNERSHRGRALRALVAYLGGRTGTGGG